MLEGERNGFRVSQARANEVREPTGLTCLRHHTADPGTVVVHLPYAAIHLGAVVGSVGLPVATSAAPDGSPVVGANKEVLAVKSLQPGAIGAHVRVHRVVQRLDVALTLPFPALFHGRRQGDDARVRVDDNQDPQVRDGHECQEEGMQDEHGDGGPCIVAVAEEILNWRMVSRGGTSSVGSGDRRAVGGGEG